MLTIILSALEAWPPIAALRTSTMLYALVNALHILGLGVLLGAMLTLDVRILGWYGTLPLRAAVRDLGRAAAAGLLIATLTGILLFSVRATQYIENPALLLKWALLAFALANVVWFRQSLRRLQGDTPNAALRLSAALSALLWIGAVGAGRWIAFSVNAQE